MFDRLETKRTAHVVVDLQNGLMAPGAVAEAREIVPTVNRITESVRDAGGLVVYIQNTFVRRPGPCPLGWPGSAVAHLRQTAVA